jgi:transcriptional regulator with XRE-family HTH domain
MPSAPLLTRAVVALREALAARDPQWTQTELAQALGVSQAAISGWFRGRCRPEPTTMLRLEETYGIPVRAWLEPAPELPAAAHVYVAAPYADAPAVRTLHAELRRAGLLPVSRWAVGADGPEALDALPVSAVRALARQNDRDLLSAHMVIALARDGAGGEMFAEVRLALDSGIPVLWVGTRRPLTAYREGVARVLATSDAVGLAQSFAELISRPSRMSVKPSSKASVKWARRMIWSSIEQLERGAEGEVAA